MSLPLRNVLPGNHQLPTKALVDVDVGFTAVRASPAETIVCVRNLLATVQPAVCSWFTARPQECAVALLKNADAVSILGRVGWCCIGLSCEASQRSLRTCSEGLQRASHGRERAEQGDRTCCQASRLPRNAASTPRQEMCFRSMKYFCGLWMGDSSQQIVILLQSGRMMMRPDSSGEFGSICHQSPT